jgi:hypothetical protein
MSGEAIPQFSIDNLPLDLHSGLGGNVWGFFQKTTSTKAIRIDRPFAVITIHGGDAQIAEAGDWLAIDAAGHPYPIAAAVFRATFTPVLPEGAPGIDGPPAEGSRREVIRDTIYAYPIGQGSLADNALGLADRIEIALQSAEEQPTGPAHESPSVPVLYTAREQLQSVSDVDRGRLLEMVGGAAGVVGGLVSHAAAQLEGFPPDVKAAAFLLAALGIADQAGEP